MLVVKCVSCYHFNKEKGEGDLPMMCPNSNTPCFAIKSEYITNDIKRESFIKEIARYNEGKTAKFRFPIDNKYIDLDFDKKMSEAYNKCIKAGIEVNNDEVY